MKAEMTIADAVESGLAARNGAEDRLGIHGWFHMECRGEDGELKWAETFPNTVTNVGRDNVLNVYFGSTSKATSFYVGLKGSGTPAAADTMASHSTWTEVTDYTGNRPAYTVAATTSQSVTNSASVATFSINNTVTVAGAFLVDNSTKGGTTGTLFSAASFTSRSLLNTDTLTVTYTVND